MRRLAQIEDQPQKIGDVRYLNAGLLDMKAPLATPVRGISLKNPDCYWT